jgi:uncharacterized protein YgbK (DUF1537 family)
MIGVIADDLTGAAEVGAVGFRYGLRSEIVLAGEPSSDAQLVCLDTDSRSCSASEAAERTARAARLLRQQGAEWVYKKTDSLLRGNVTSEIEAIVSQLGLHGALLVPANPSLGRTIEGGHYFVGGRLLNETEFARDPRHPRLSSKLSELLDAPAALRLWVRRPEDGLPERALVIGEAASAEDLRQWAALRNGRWLMAGGAEFFAAQLRLPASDLPAEHLPGRELFVCGSSSEATRNFVAHQQAQGVRVFSLPLELAAGGSFDAGRMAWLVDRVVEALESTTRVVLCVGLPLVTDTTTAEMLARQLVRVAERVIQCARVPHVLAEGGATAVALARQMGWRRLQVTAVIAPGVVRLSPETKDLTSFTIKPGSYPWPPDVAEAHLSKATAR